MRQRPVIWVLIAVLLIINLTYWQDPWLWRNYVHFFSSGELTGVERLQPDEEIRGDGSYVLPVAGAGQRTISSASLAAMHDYAQEFGSHALITVHRGMIQDEWYADHWQHDWMTQSQSMHKSLMGLFIGMAIEDGRISSVDAPIDTWITEWADDPRGRITLRNLMQMSSGLGQYGFTLNPFDDGMKWLNSGRSIEAILRTPLADWAPGSKWEYNNINSELLGMALVRIYGQRYSVLLRDRLWLPMGGERAQIHTDSPGGRAFTSCCLAAPAMDWVRVGMLLLGRGVVNGKRIISEEWLEQMITPSSVAGYYGYQTWLGYDDPAIPVDDSVGSSGALASEPFLARDTFMTWGRGQQHVFVVPSQELVIVRLGPALGRLPIKPGFDVTYFVNTAIRGLKQPDAMP
ncbi:MAG: serine hydrolase [Gammaproteobacteria bacterium]|jgi:CubicO group peptidase (beta-lactamase class C family)|nr:hypothetical protein [Chromatiales bacterium]MDP6673869.1 serine hydrolase [Gammaproteobacteria bacterium]